MKHLYEYINEIMDIASVNHAEPQNAKDMFLANIRNAGDPTLPHYRGAGNVDYAALAEDLPGLTREGAALTQALFDRYRELVELHRAGRYAEAVELMRGAVEAAEGDEFVDVGQRCVALPLIDGLSGYPQLFPQILLRQALFLSFGRDALAGGHCGHGIVLLCPECTRGGGNRPPSGGGFLLTGGLQRRESLGGEAVHQLKYPSICSRPALTRP